MVFSTRLPLSSLIDLCRVLRHSLGAGLMLRDVFRQQAKRGLAPVRPVAQRISQALERGESLETALEKERNVFPPLFLALAGVGENTGNMPEIFGALEKYYTMQQRFWRQFMSQATLPILQFIAAVLIISGMIFVLGILGSNLDPLGLGLRGTSGALTFMGTAFGLVAAVIFGYMLLSRNLEQKAVVDSILLSLPAIGPFLMALTLARFALALQLTLDTGMPIAEALTLSLRGTGNAAFARKTKIVRQTLLDGEDLTLALTRTNLFPEDFLHMVAVGEQGGEVPELMRKLAVQYEEEAERRLAVLTKVSGFGVWVFVATLIVIAIFRMYASYFNVINQFN
jgi:type IV pilus assembly protein PilC